MGHREKLQGRIGGSDEAEGGRSDRPGEQLVESSGSLTGDQPHAYCVCRAVSHRTRVEGMRKIGTDTDIDGNAWMRWWSEGAAVGALRLGNEKACLTRAPTGACGAAIGDGGAAVGACGAAVGAGDATVGASVGVCGSVVGACGSLVGACGSVVGVCGSLVGACGSVVGACGSLVGACGSASGACGSLVGACGSVVGVCGSAGGACGSVVGACGATANKESHCGGAFELNWQGRIFQMVRRASHVLVVGWGEDVGGGCSGQEDAKVDEVAAAMPSWERRLGPGV